MRNALQDQLLKAGLVNDKQIKKAGVEKRKEIQQKQGNKALAAVEEEHRQKALRAQAEKAEKDRQLNLQRNEAAEQKAIAAQIKQLIETHRLPKGDDETAYNFTDGGKVKTLRVSAAVRDQIIRGVLAVAKQAEQYELVSAEVAAKIRARNADYLIVDYSLPQTPGAEEEDDPYAKYQVPDDLIW
ncbi:MAG: DUF2058 domain-containing protein [Methylococcaceae bacterium]|nr:MAG: DUF2058 domain-containing protein [Methylococcaceae bacterium]